MLFYSLVSIIMIITNYKSLDGSIIYIGMMFIKEKKLLTK
jgi:hypothetical protein